MTFDLILANGCLVDGTEAPGRRVDVGVSGKEIAAIGDLTEAPATRRAATTSIILTLRAAQT
jgi:N-acyl-D-aspartate/D-glutamate deacylase